MTIIKNLILIAACIYAFPATPDEIDDLTNILKGRTGRSWHDERTPIRAPLTKTRIGCQGDTKEANVKITNVSGTKQDDKTIVLSVTYSGTYFRQGWNMPCTRVPRELRGVEERNVSGTYTFRVEKYLGAFIAEGKGSNFGELADSNHPSNILAMEAVKEAIGSAFKR